MPPAPWTSGSTITAAVSSPWRSSSFSSAAASPAGTDRLLNSSGS